MVIIIIIVIIMNFLAIENPENHFNSIFSILFHILTKFRQ